MAAWNGDSALLGLLPGTTGEVDPSSAATPAGTSGVAVGSGTGQHGIIPLVGSWGGGGMLGAFSSLWDWLNKPFTTPLAPFDIFLIIGVGLVSILLWNLFLMHLRMAAEAI